MNYLEKLLSIVVPCYNSQDYIDRCVESLLPGNDRVEILLIDDGSTDRTAEIIDKYERTYPKQIKAVHQENGGHGQAVNTGMYLAKGKYVKVVDSDDWLDLNSYQKVLNFLESLEESNEEIDMLICNYIYDKVELGHKKVIKYRWLPKNKSFTWNKVHLLYGEYFLMHAVIYRTSLVTKEAKLKLPKHKFYVDNLYVFEPLPYIKKMYYLDVDLYHYFIGREDQSVNEKVMLKRIDQQLYVNKRMIKFYAENIDVNSDVGKYMKRYLEIITTISSILLIRGNTKEYLDLKDDLWNYLKEYDDVYRILRRRLFGIGVNLPGKFGRKLATDVYKVAQRLYGFN